MTDFNREQLATWEEARQYSKSLSAEPYVVGAGVKPEDPDPARSGIYEPAWLSGPGGFPKPHAIDKDGKEYYFLHYRFMNGADGMNVGLIRGMFKRYPNSPLFVKRQLAREAAMLAGEAG